MKQLYDKIRYSVLSEIPNTYAAVSVPYALERRMCSSALSRRQRRAPRSSDRYVFNYRPSYAEETDAAVANLGENPPDTPRQIALFAQSDPVAMRDSRCRKGIFVRSPWRQRRSALNYQRKTPSTSTTPANQLKAQRVP